MITRADAHGATTGLKLNLPTERLLFYFGEKFFRDAVFNVRLEHALAYCCQGFIYIFI